jgi:hypothetical protein
VFEGNTTAPAHWRERYKDAAKATPVAVGQGRTNFPRVYDARRPRIERRVRRRPVRRECCSMVSARSDVGSCSGVGAIFFRSAQAGDKGDVGPNMIRTCRL